MLYNFIVMILCVLNATDNCFQITPDLNVGYVTIYCILYNICVVLFVADNSVCSFLDILRLPIIPNIVFVMEMFELTSGILPLCMQQL